MSENNYGQELRKIVERMKVLGFYYRVSNNKGAQFHVRFEEKGNRPDPISQSGKDMDLLKATKYAALKTIDFINMIGPDWKDRPIKEGCEYGKPRLKLDQDNVDDEFVGAKEITQLEINKYFEMDNKEIAEELQQLQIDRDSLMNLCRQANEEYGLLILPGCIEQIEALTEKTRKEIEEDVVPE